MTNDSPLVQVALGMMPGEVIVADKEAGFAIIKSLEQEAAVHWLAFPFESYASLDEMRTTAPERFLQLFAFVQEQVECLKLHYPLLEHGYTVKFHCGAYETVAHAKLHILSTE